MRRKPLRLSINHPISKCKQIVRIRLDFRIYELFTPFMHLNHLCDAVDAGS